MTNQPLPTTQLPGLIAWVITGQARHVMTALGGALLAHGFLPNQAADQQFIQWGVSGVLIIGGMLWSALEKKQISSPNP